MWLSQYVLGLITCIALAAEFEDDGGIVLLRDDRDTSQISGSGSGSGSGDCEKPCPEIQLHDRGTVSYDQNIKNGIMTGTIASFSCLRDYHLPASSVTQATCNADGTWSHDPPKCLPDFCPKIKYMRKGGITNRNARIGETTSYSCKNGYRLVPNRDKNECLPGGIWKYAQPVCVKNGDSVDRCPTVPYPNGFVRTRNQEKLGSKITFRCTGFSGHGRYGYASGQREIDLLCDATGKWDGAIPLCERIDCGDMKVANGRVTYDSHRRRLFGTQAYFSCNKGFKLHPPGRTSVICNYGGFWIADFPVCTEEDCGEDRQIRTTTSMGIRCPLPCPRIHFHSRGVVSYNPRVGERDPIPPGTRASFSCGKSFVTTESSPKFATCMADGTWQYENDQLPDCTLEKCPRIRYLRNGKVTINGKKRDLAKVGEVAKYECKSGFRLEPDIDTVACLTGGSWERDQPVCVKNGDSIKECPQVPFRDGRVRVTDRHRIGSKITFTCGSKYAFRSGAEKVILRCGSNGQWLGDVPKCERARCCGMRLAKGDVDFKNGRNLAVGTEARFRCGRGYVLYPPHRTAVTCELGGTWSDTFPVCVEEACISIPGIPAGDQPFWL